MIYALIYPSSSSGQGETIDRWHHVDVWNWTVIPTKAADKQAAKLNESVMLKLRYLFMDLSIQGPAVSDWPNYGKLKGQKGDKRHCHLQKGRPTYVCCWKVYKKRKIIVGALNAGEITPDQAQATIHALKDMQGL